MGGKLVPLPKMTGERSGAYPGADHVCDVTNNVLGIFAIFLHVLHLRYGPMYMYKVPCWTTVDDRSDVIRFRTTDSSDRL